MRGGHRGTWALLFAGLWCGLSQCAVRDGMSAALPVRPRLALTGTLQRDNSPSLPFAALVESPLRVTLELLDPLAGSLGTVRLRGHTVEFSLLGKTRRFKATPRRIENLIGVAVSARQWWDLWYGTIDAALAPLVTIEGWHERGEVRVPRQLRIVQREHQLTLTITTVDVTPVAHMR